VAPLLLSTVRGDEDRTVVSAALLAFSSVVTTLGPTALSPNVIAETAESVGIVLNKKAMCEKLSQK